MLVATRYDERQRSGSRTTDAAPMPATRPLATSSLSGSACFAAPMPFSLAPRAEAPRAWRPEGSKGR